MTPAQDRARILGNLRQEAIRALTTPDPGSGVLVGPKTLIELIESYERRTRVEIAGGYLIEFIGLAELNARHHARKKQRRSPRRPRRDPKVTA